MNFEVPQDLRLAALVQEYDGRWRAYLQQWPPGMQLLGFHGRTPQEAIDITASALRARIKVVEIERPQVTKLNLTLDLSTLLKRE